MNRKILATRLQSKLSESGEEVTYKQAYAAVEAFCNGIQCGLSLDGRVELRGFGVFKTTPRRARAVRNPTTGERVDVPASQGILFRPGSELRALVNGDQ